MRTTCTVNPTRTEAAHELPPCAGNDKGIQLTPPVPVWPRACHRISRPDELPPDTLKSICTKPSDHNTRLRERKKLEAELAETGPRFLRKCICLKGPGNELAGSFFVCW